MRGPLSAALTLASAHLLAGALQAQDVPRPGAYPAAYDSAAVAWHEGRYPEALERLDALLGGPDAARILEPAALLTGELYHTTELAPDGRAPRWSPDGRWAAFETLEGTGPAATRTTHVVPVGAAQGRAAQGRAARPARIAGSGLVFSPDGRSAAYLVVTTTPALDSARAELARQLRTVSDEPSYRRWQARQAEVARLEAETARVVVRDLASGRERELAAPGLRRYAVAWGDDARTLHLVGAATGSGPETRDVWALDAAGRGAPRRLTEGAGVRGGLAASRGVLGWATSDTSFAILPPGGGAPVALRGADPAISADGTTLAWVAREGDEHTLTVARVANGTVTPVRTLRVPHRVANPAVSPDGRRVAFQQMTREDWEIHVLERDAGDEQAPVASRRVTQEIQHDRWPRFVDSVRVLAAKGEGRHMRSYVYDVRSGEGHRLFHNNTVRTVAPEYEWAVSPDATKVLVVSERDGDTISPERGVYVVDLARRTTAPEVRARVRAQLAAERALRARGDSLFAPVADAVRAAAGEVSVARVQRYADDLHRLGTKYVGTPGNLAAIEYLVATLKSFGYEPEVQWFDVGGQRTANVVVRIEGTTNPGLVYAVTSHFDSVEDGPGADDNSSGTTALLEVARVLARRPQAATIELAWLTGEEAGLHGAREYVRRAKASSKRIVGALNNDMVGWANDDRLDDTIRYSNEGLRDLQHAAAFLFTDLITYDAKYYKNTDAHILYDGYGDVVAGIGSYPILGNPHYHQTHDVLETVNQRLVAEVARTTAASIMRMAAGPSRLAGVTVKPAGGAGAGAGALEVTWTPAAERGVTGYVVAWGTADAPFANRTTVQEPRAVLERVPAGAAIGVKAVVDGGLESWDWARPEPTTTAGR